MKMAKNVKLFPLSQNIILYICDMPTSLKPTSQWEYTVVLYILYDNWNSLAVVTMEDKGVLK